MRLNHSSIHRLSLLAIAFATSLVLVPSAGAITLYDGSYATDMSSSVPAGLAPASGTTLAYPTSNIRLYWNQVPGADKYQLQIARQSSSSADCSASSAFQLDNILLTSTTAQNEWVPTQTSDAEGEAIWTGTYCWRVRTTGKGAGEWSTGNRFTRTWSSAISGLRFYNDHDGPVPRTSADADYATGSTLTRNAGYLQWTRLPGAAKYEVQVSTSQSFADQSIMVHREGITDSRVALLHLPDDTYYWRVRAVTPNGTEGSWTTASNTFTVRWLDDAWNDPSRLQPADSSTQSEVRIGWTPMPGATHYEVQVATSAGCFWNPDVPELAPLPWGAWVDYKPEFDDSDPPILLRTGDPRQSHCRLSDIRQTTINNWMTLESALGDDAWKNVNKDCYDEEEGKVLCEPAGMPVSSAVNWGAVYHGSLESVGGADDGQYSTPTPYLYWRVRPVYSVTQATESGWKIAGTGISAYGSWTRYTSGGANRQHRFTLDPTTAPWASVGTRCDGLENPTSTCLEHDGTSMQADQPIGVAVDTSMQFPILTWKPVSIASGYIIEIARDPLFNNVATTVQQVAGYQQSWAMTESMPDNSEGTGYWWRVVPCQWELPPPGYVELRCMPIYSSASAGLPLSTGISPTFADMGVAQTFTKQSGVQVSVVENFEGASPLLRWTRSGTSATDYAGWSRGLEGAKYYDVELARNPFFTGSDKISLKTTIPRIVPFLADSSTAGSIQALPDGIWYYRIRGVDRNDVQGGWSAVASFNKRVEAPALGSTGDGETGPGVTIGWDTVQGAGSYDVQWSTDSGFEGGINAASTRQTMFRIPDSPTGTYYWRVRAVVGGIEGQWSSQARWVRIVPATSLRYALNRDLTLAGDKVQVTGELKVAGTQTNGQLVRLQRKTGGCDATAGSYVDASVATTGEDADDGMVNIPAKVVQNTCFRLAWVNDAAVKYSAPIPVKVAPNVGFKVDRKLVRRGKPVCTTLRSNVALTGRARVQYRAGTGAWATSRSATLRGVKSTKMCAKFTRAGRYKMRVVLDGLVHPSGGWKQYETVIRGTGAVRVNDLWRIVRSR